jgi:hypothetical protein
MRPSGTWRWESAQHGYVCAVVLVASQHVSVVWSCGVTGSASGRLGNVPNAELDALA